MTRQGLLQLATILFASTGVVLAQAPVPQSPVPSLALLATDGSRVDLQQLVAEGRWLLVTVHPACPPCDRLLPQLPHWLPPGRLDRVLVVVVGRTPDAGRYLSRVVPLEAEKMRSYLDPGGVSPVALDLTTGLALVAIENGRIAWKLDGVLNDPLALEPVVRSWLGF